MKVKSIVLAISFLFMMHLQIGLSFAASTYIAITPEQEGDIRQGTPNSSYDTAAQHWVRYSTAAFSCKSYIRFKLPADFRAATSAQIRFTRTSDQGGSFKHSVYGLKDGIVGETTWANQTWNSALAHNPAASDAGYAFTSDAVYFGYFRSDASGVGVQNLYSSSSLLDFINSDTNGYITIMISRPVDQDSTSANEFASKYNGTYPPPALEMNYEPAILETKALSPVADTFVKAGGPDLVFGPRAYLAIQNSTTYPDRNLKIYMKFHIPEADLHITSAKLKLTTLNNGNPAWTWNFNVFGLKDGVAGSDWQVGTSHTNTGSPSDGITWNNAPANNKSNGTDFTSDATNSLGIFAVTNPAVGIEHSMASSDFLGFIKAHPGQDVTIMMSRIEDSTAEFQFASSTNQAGYNIPTLEIVGYRCVQLIGDFNNDCYINFRDFAEMATDWLDCTEPDPVKCN
jgi:hypothetical protein